MKRGFADYAATVGDPDFVQVPLAELLSADYARARAAEIKPDLVTPKVAAGAAAKQEPPSTTSLSVVDAQGNMVALTQTISDFFGAKVLVAGTGIILNNEMKNFGTRGPNAIAPGKRMRTMIAPTILLKDGQDVRRPRHARRGPHRLDDDAARVEPRRLRHGHPGRDRGPALLARESKRTSPSEARVPAATLDALRRWGTASRPIATSTCSSAGPRASWIDPKTGMRIGGADPRRDGAVVGYPIRQVIWPLPLPLALLGIGFLLYYALTSDRAR